MIIIVDLNFSLFRPAIVIKQIFCIYKQHQKADHWLVIYSLLILRAFSKNIQLIQNYKIISLIIFFYLLWLKFFHFKITHIKKFYFYNQESFIVVLKIYYIITIVNILKEKVDIPVE